MAQGNHHEHAVYIRLIWEDNQRDRESAGMLGIVAGKQFYDLSVAPYKTEGSHTGEYGSGQRARKSKPNSGMARPIYFKFAPTIKYT